MLSTVLSVIFTRVVQSCVFLIPLYPTPEGHESFGESWSVLVSLGQKFSDELSWVCFQRYKQINHLNHSVANQATKMNK